MEGLAAISVPTPYVPLVYFNCYRECQCPLRVLLSSWKSPVAWIDNLRHAAIFPSQASAPLPALRFPPASGAGLARVERGRPGMLGSSCPRVSSQSMREEGDERIPSILAPSCDSIMACSTTSKETLSRVQPMLLYQKITHNALLFTFFPCLTYLFSHHVSWDHLPKITTRSKLLPLVFVDI